MWQVKKGAFKILPIAGDHFEMYRNMEKGKHYIVHLELTCCRSLYFKKKKDLKLNSIHQIHFLKNWFFVFLVNYVEGFLVHEGM